MQNIYGSAFKVSLRKHYRLALHPKRDLVDRRPRMRTPELPSRSDSPSNPSSTNSSVPTSPNQASPKSRQDMTLSEPEKELLRMITSLTGIDVQLRRKKMERFRSHREAVKLTNAIRLAGVSLSGPRRRFSLRQSNNKAIYRTRTKTPLRGISALSSLMTPPQSPLASSTPCWNGRSPCPSIAACR